MKTKDKVTVGFTHPWLLYLSLVLIVLKLTGLISWSWWLVLSPMLLGAAFIFVAGVLWLVAYRLKEQAIRELEALKRL
jgi:hypothetical protein